MSKIRIKYFGAIKEGYRDNEGWLDIKKVTVFIGSQGTGKSTIAKLISTFTWIEKALVRGDYQKKWFERKNRFKNQILTYHRLENYFLPNSDDKVMIEYQGDAYTIIYQKDALTIKENARTSYHLPQLIYIPAERNFLTYVKTLRELKLSSDSLQEFLAEFENAKEAMRGSVALPINNVSIEYDRLNSILSLKGEAYKVKLTDASSGFQSFVPLFLVSNYLAHSIKKENEKNKAASMSDEEIKRFRKGVEEIWRNESLSDEQRRVALSVLSAKFNKTAFINIVEEPEQNLFPASQWQALKNLLALNNMAVGNKLIMTTHSPYMINFLTIAIQGAYLQQKIHEANKNAVLLPKLNKVIPEESLIDLKDIAIYQIDAEQGDITQLSTIEGIPSDRNYLNDFIREGNQLFDVLLALEEEI
ncbi:hypothetical protein BegalDRAFT_0659 [Beggiatoa alba B18LD]|uniref:Uncharacterized protein n=1 Tax=Beggiatoa alba B18LD TaxID=395493 RepID=I3CD78_9GAMM|nr:AAA family ATPase [Beggiatoa alba]EIJ41571.1 hypothetical protein BegalDRAFT_0659 [Beggiatoa alba B18LD]